MSSPLKTTKNRKKGTGEESPIQALCRISEYISVADVRFSRSLRLETRRNIIPLFSLDHVVFACCVSTRTRLLFERETVGEL